jgi:hypothetical protein
MPVEEAEELARELSEFGYRETTDPDEADRRRYYKVESGTRPSYTSRRSCTLATTSPGPGRSSPPRKHAGRAAATRYARTSGCWSAGRRMASASARPRAPFATTPSARRLMAWVVLL